MPQVQQENNLEVTEETILPVSQLEVRKEAKNDLYENNYG